MFYAAAFGTMWSCLMEEQYRMAAWEDFVETRLFRSLALRDILPFISLQTMNNSLEVSNCFTTLQVIVSSIEVLVHCYI